MIQRIQPNNSPAFHAKFYSYHYNITAPELFSKFKEITRAYPNLTLEQGSLSFFGKDCFNLINNDKLIGLGFFKYTSVPKKNLDSSVDILFDIFNKMVAKAIKARTLQ